MKSFEIRDNTGDTLHIRVCADGVIETDSTSTFMLWSAEKVQALVDALKTAHASVTAKPEVVKPRKIKDTPQA